MGFPLTNHINSGMGRPLTWRTRKRWNQWEGKHNENQFPHFLWSPGLILTLQSSLHSFPSWASMSPGAWRKWGWKKRSWVCSPSASRMQDCPLKRMCKQRGHHIWCQNDPVPPLANNFCSPLRMKMGQSGSERSRLDYQMTWAADPSLMVIKQEFGFCFQREAHANSDKKCTTCGLAAITV